MKKIASLLIIIAIISSLFSCDGLFSKAAINGVKLKNFSIVYSESDADYSQRAAEYIHDEILERAGLDVSKIRGYTFKAGSKGGNSGKAEDSGLTCSVCNAPITQAEASFSEAKCKAKLCRKCQKDASKKPAPSLNI